jgi:hypothetical protein
MLSFVMVYIEDYRPLFFTIILRLAIRYDCETSWFQDMIRHSVSIVSLVFPIAVSFSRFVLVSTVSIDRIVWRTCSGGTATFTGILLRIGSPTVK